MILTSHIHLFVCVLFFAVLASFFLSYSVYSFVRHRFIKISMDSNGTNGTTNNDVHSNADDVLSTSRQDSLSESLLESSELNDETDIETMRQRIHEMEEEAEKLKQMQFEVEKQMQLPGTPGTCKYRLVNTNCRFACFYLAQFPTAEEKMEADQKSVYVGNVRMNAF